MQSCEKLLRLALREEGFSMGEVLTPEVTMLRLLEHIIFDIVYIDNHLADAFNGILDIPGDIGNVDATRVKRVLMMDTYRNIHFIKLCNLGKDALRVTSNAYNLPTTNALLMEISKHIINGWASNNAEMLGVPALEGLFHDSVLYLSHIAQVSEAIETYGMLHVQQSIITGALADLTKVHAKALSKIIL